MVISSSNQTNLLDGLTKRYIPFCVIEYVLGLTSKLAYTCDTRATITQAELAVTCRIITISISIIDLTFNI